MMTQSRMYEAIKRFDVLAIIHVNESAWILK